MWIQSSIANAALRVMTNNINARAYIGLSPMIVKKEWKDDFEEVLMNIYSYISIVIFMLPMYNFIIRI